MNKRQRHLRAGVWSNSWLSYNLDTLGHISVLLLLFLSFLYFQGDQLRSGSAFKLFYFFGLVFTFLKGVAAWTKKDVVHELLVWIYQKLTKPLHFSSFCKLYLVVLIIVGLPFWSVFNPVTSQHVLGEPLFSIGQKSWLYLHSFSSLPIDLFPIWQRVLLLFILSALTAFYITVCRQVNLFLQSYRSLNLPNPFTWKEYIFYGAWIVVGGMGARGLWSWCDYFNFILATHLFRRPLFYPPKFEILCLIVLMAGLIPWILIPGLILFCFRGGHGRRVFLSGGKLPYLRLRYFSNAGRLRQMMIFCLGISLTLWIMVSTQYLEEVVAKSVPELGRGLEEFAQLGPQLAGKKVWVMPEMEFIKQDRSPLDEGDFVAKDYLAQVQIIDEEDHPELSNCLHYLLVTRAWDIFLVKAMQEEVDYVLVYRSAAYQGSQVGDSLINMAQEGKRVHWPVQHGPLIVFGIQPDYSELARFNCQPCSDRAWPKIKEGLKRHPRVLISSFGDYLIFLLVEGEQRPDEVVVRFLANDGHELGVSPILLEPTFLAPNLMVGHFMVLPKTRQLNFEWPASFAEQTPLHLVISGEEHVQRLCPSSN